MRRYLATMGFVAVINFASMQGLAVEHHHSDKSGFISLGDIVVNVFEVLAVKKHPTLEKKFSVHFKSGGMLEFTELEADSEYLDRIADEMNEIIRRVSGR